MLDTAGCSAAHPAHCLARSRSRSIHYSTQRTFAKFYSALRRAILGPSPRWRFTLNFCWAIKLLHNDTVQHKNLYQTLCNMHKEKALVGTFPGHCETSRRFVDSSSIHSTRSSTLLHTGPGSQYRAASHCSAVTLNLSIKMCHILALVHQHQHCHPGPGVRSCPACTHQPALSSEYLIYLTNIR